MVETVGFRVDGLGPVEGSGLGLRFRVLDLRTMVENVGFRV